MTRVALAVARFAVSAWVGAAVLFVITSVREVRYGGFGSTIRDELARLRFPPYYAAGFVLIGTGIAGTVIAWRRLKPRGLAVFGLLAAALVLMVVDYFWIYGPLTEMITPPGQGKPARFQVLHVASEWVNAANVLLCLLAAGVLNWPESGRKKAQDSQNEGRRDGKADLR